MYISPGLSSFTSPLCAASVAAGQTLNFAMYATIGNAGVYYGFKLGRPVPWATAFPFNVGLRHPQYVGVVLTILGLATTQLSHATAAAGLPQVAAAWAAMYVVMAAMEEVGDNDKSSNKAGTIDAKSPSNLGADGAWLNVEMQLDRRE